MKKTTPTATTIINPLIVVLLFVSSWILMIEAINPSSLQGQLLGLPATKTATATMIGRHRSASSFSSFSTTKTQRSMVLDLFDPLEPLELAWELYCARYEILDEMIQKTIVIVKKNSKRAIVLGGSALLIGQVLSKLGVLGDGTTPNSNNGWTSKVEKSKKRLKDGAKERAYQKTGSFFVNNALKRFRKLGGSSKFAISVSAGSFFGQAAIKTTALCVRTALTSFFVIETMSFLGIIGHRGESILDWVEDERKRHAGWTETLAVYHRKVFKMCSLEVLEDLYKATVDEEKIASFGFSVGTIFALLS